MSRTLRLSSSLNIVFIINESPWGTTLAATAARVASRVRDTGHTLQAVFFREDGVYNCITGTAVESGSPDLLASWVDLNDRQGTELLVCQASAARRLGHSLAAPFRESGLVEITDLIADCDRVVTF